MKGSVFASDIRASNSKMTISAQKAPQKIEVFIKFDIEDARATESELYHQ